MKLRRPLMWIALVVFALTLVESSILVKQSLLKPRLPQPCFTSRAEDRPFAYPLIGYLVKMKDMFVKGLNVLVDKTKEYKLK